MAEQHIAQSSNAFRAQQGRSPLQFEDALTRAARHFAQHMASADRYGHNADGRNPAQRARAQGYAHCQVLENIAWQYNSQGITNRALADGFVQGWINSPGHRRNLLEPAITHTGVGVARSARSGRYYAVQLLGQPASASWRFELGNFSQQTIKYQVEDQPFELARRTWRWHEQCTPVTLRVLWLGQQATALVPEPGSKLRVESVGGKLLVR